jgi:hypothetical protein
VFAGRAYENLRSSPLERIVVTDTIPLRPDVPASIAVVSCASLLADSIRRIFTDDSVSAVSGGKNHPFWLLVDGGPGPSRGTVLLGRTATPGVPNTRAGRAATRSGR